MVDGCIPLLSDDPLVLLDTSGVVGDWVHDLGEDRIALSQHFAALLGIDMVAASRGIPMADFLQRMQPLDSAKITVTLGHLRETGGAFNARFEVPTGSDGPRMMQMLGRIERDEPGRTASGRGIAFDVTESRTAELRQHEGQVNLMAEHAIALHQIADRLRRPVLLQLVNGVMAQIGLELAQVLDQTRTTQRGAAR